MLSSSPNRPEAPPADRVQQHRAVPVLPLPAVRARAFSMMELVVVLAIIAIVSAMAIPRYGDAIARFRVDAAARRIASDIAQTQARAKARSTPQTIDFDAANSAYSIKGMNDPAFPAKTYAVALTDEPYHATLRAVNFGGSPTLLFNGFGVPVMSGAANGSVTVRSGAYQKTVSVDADSGVTTISNFQ